MLSYAISCLVSVQRVDAFLQEEELDKFASANTPESQNSQTAIGFSNATLSWYKGIERVDTVPKFIT